MKEIEVKAHLKNADQVIGKLKTLGCILSEPMRQTDTVYAKVVNDVEAYLKNDHFIRIRKTGDGRSIFTVKKSVGGHALTKAEYETEIKDPVALEQALFLMGYQVANRVMKSRRTSQYKDFEICLDDVEGLGSFIEIEKMSEGNVDVVRNELNDFLMSLGVSAGDEVHKGYDILMMEKR